MKQERSLPLMCIIHFLPSGIFLFDVFTPLKYAKEKIGKYVRMDSGIKIYIYYYMLFIVMKKIIHF